MVQYADSLRALEQQTLSVPWLDGLLVALMMLLWGFCVSVGIRTVTSYPGVSFIARLLLGATVIRYLQSFVVYHHGLTEGIWPLFWTVSMVSGVAAAHRSPRAGTGD